jgi:hypothetical protein
MAERKLPIVPLDFEAIEKHIKWFLDIEKFGYGCVEITDHLDKIVFPKRFYEFCMKYDLKPHVAIFMIVSDFITRYYNGNNLYEQGILNRVRTANIPEEERKKILKILLDERLDQHE